MVETVGFDYGQRHKIELDMRPRVLDAMRKALYGEILVKAHWAIVRS